MDSSHIIIVMVPSLIRNKWILLKNTYFLKNKSYFNEALHKSRLSAKLEKEEKSVIVGNLYKPP